MQLRMLIRQWRFHNLWPAHSVLQSHWSHCFTGRNLLFISSEAKVSCWVHWMLNLRFCLAFCYYFIFYMCVLGLFPKTNDSQKRMQVFWQTYILRWHRQAVSLASVLHTGQLKTRTCRIVCFTYLFRFVVVSSVLFFDIDVVSLIPISICTLLRRDVTYESGVRYLFSQMRLSLISVICG